QAGSCHRAHTARYGCDPAGALYGNIELNIPDQLAIGLPIDAHVDDDGAFLDPLAFNQPGNASRHYDQVGTLDVLAQIMGESMGNGGGAARQQQFQRHGAAHDIRGADDDGIEPVQIDASAFQ